MKNRRKIQGLIILLFVTVILLPQHRANSFSLQHYKKCGKTGVLILPEPGVKFEAYRKLINYFTGLCWDVWILIPEEGENYSLSYYSQVIDQALSKIVISDFTVVVHGMGSIPYLITSSVGDYRLHTVFLGPVFFPDDFSAAMKEVISTVKEGEPLCWKNFMGKHIPGFKSIKDIPFLLFFNDTFISGNQKNAVEEYLSCIPHDTVKELREWIKNGVIKNTLFFNTKKMAAQLERIKGFIITGHVDNVAPYYLVYDHVKNAPHLKFLLASRESFMKTEFGHLSILTGKYAEKNIFKEIYLWVEYSSKNRKLKENIPF